MHRSGTALLLVNYAQGYFPVLKRRGDGGCGAAATVTEHKIISFWLLHV